MKDLFEGSHGYVPLAELIPESEIGLKPFPRPHPEWPPFPEPKIPQIPEHEFEQGFKFPKWPTFCAFDLKQGCYRINFQPKSIFPFALAFNKFEGTMRVENRAGGRIVSGDLYRLPLFVFVSKTDAGDDAIPDEEASKTDGATPGIIPIYARRRYHSYLKATSVYVPSFSYGTCEIAMTIEQYLYTHPATGFHGSFAATPFRTLTVGLSQTGPGAFSGKAYVAGVEVGTLDMIWVNSQFRRATIEVDAVSGTAPPVATTNPVSGNPESFTTIYASAGWDVNTVYSNLALPLPPGTGGSWSDGELHGFMVANDSIPNLDAEWSIHLSAVPGDCDSSPGALGLMFDDIGDHREGAASFRNNFTGVFNNNRVYLRSAAHEAGHGFNQLHPSDEGLANDNSIMSQTGAARSVITSGGGMFPRDLNMAFNAHDRHHLIHFPDPIVRPGAMNWTSGHFSIFAPEATDAIEMGESLSLNLDLAKNRIKLGEPLEMKWTLKNLTDNGFIVPSDLNWKKQSVQTLVTDPDGKQTPVRSFAIICDSNELKELQSGGSIGGNTMLYWSSGGFAFTKPGRHLIQIAAIWGANCKLYKVSTQAEVWVDYPIDEKDNTIAELLLNEEVGKFVALGGNAPHLKEAVRRIEQAVRLQPKHNACECLCQLKGHGYSAVGKGKQPKTEKKK